MANLITASEVIDIAFENDIDSELIKQSIIEMVEQNYIKEALTKDLYDDVVANPTKTDNAELLPIIKNAMAYYVRAESVIDMAVEATSNGLMKNNDEFGSAAGRTERSDSKQQSLENGDRFCKMIITHINEARDVDSTRYELFVDVDSIKNRTRLPGGMVI